jgi:hypothetical protein
VELDSFPLTFVIWVTVGCSGTSMALIIIRAILHLRFRDTKYTFPVWYVIFALLTAAAIYPGTLQLILDNIGPTVLLIGESMVTLLWFGSLIRESNRLRRTIRASESRTN